METSDVLLKNICGCCCCCVSLRERLCCWDEPSLVVCELSSRGTLAFVGVFLSVLGVLSGSLGGTWTCRKLLALPLPVRVPEGREYNVSLPLFVVVIMALSTDVGDGVKLGLLVAVVLVALVLLPAVGGGCAVLILEAVL